MRRVVQREHEPRHHDRCRVAARTDEIHDPRIARVVAVAHRHAVERVGVQERRERARLLPCRALDRALAALLKRAHVIIGADHIEPVVIDQRLVRYQRKRRLLNRRV